MFAIAFDRVVAEAQKHHPKGVAQAYADIKSTRYQAASAETSAAPRRVPRDGSEQPATVERKTNDADTHFIYHKLKNLNLTAVSSRRPVGTWPEWR